MDQPGRSVPRVDIRPLRGTIVSVGEEQMPILRLLEGAAFTPEQVNLIVAAYEKCLKGLGLVNRADPFAEAVARKIIEVANEGETDPDLMCERATRELQDAKS